MTSFQHRIHHARGALLVAGALVLSASPAGAQLTIRLRVPPGTPPDAPVHVAGTFNNWNPASPAHRLAAQGGEYVITLPADVRGAVEFKFTLGSWESVELDSLGAGVPNRTFVVPETGAATYTAAVTRWQSPAQVPRRPSTARATVSVLDTAFPMPQLGRTRKVWIYLPPDYAASDKRYPVLYMHDGQNVFDDSTSYAGEWGVDESLDSLHAAGDPGVIVVAVDNGQQLRMNEYSPWRHPRHGGGEGDAYADFLAQTLKPWIDQRYRTRPGPESTGVMGSSMGGLISLHAALRHPGVFGRAGVFSPSLWFSDSVWAAARNASPAGERPRFYFVSGGLEGPQDRPRIVVNDQRRMVDTLAAAGWRVGTEIHAAAPDDGRHSEWFWRREFPAAYRWLFSQTPPAAPR